MFRNYIFALVASILILPTVAQAGENPVVVKTIPVNTPGCLNHKRVPVAAGAPQNISITQRRVVRSTGANRTEVYQSTTSTSSSSTSTTVNTVPSVCVLPQTIMNNVLITP